ncbi:MAG: Mth938-like domain-containing protein [Nanoarchaeota archaeon]
MIEEFKFGFFKIDGKQYYDDIKILGISVKQWGDRERHNLKLNNLKEILTFSPELLIVGIGATGLLEVSDEIKNHLRQSNIKLIVEKTPQACESYNKALAEKKKVAAIMHATC